MHLLDFFDVYNSVQDMFSLKRFLEYFGCNGFDASTQVTKVTKGGIHK